MTERAASPTPTPTPTSGPTPGPESEPDLLAAALRTAIGDLIRATRSVDRLAPIPAAVLDLLDRRGPMTTAELAASRGVRHQTMAASVRELTEAGYLSAGPDPADARKKNLELTAAGRGSIIADRRARTALLAHALAENLTEAEREVLTEALPLLDRLATAVTPTGPGSSPERGLVSGAW